MRALIRHNVILLALAGCSKPCSDPHTCWELIDVSLVADQPFMPEPDPDPDEGVSIALQVTGFLDDSELYSEAISFEATQEGGYVLSDWQQELDSVGWCSDTGANPEGRNYVVVFSLQSDGDWDPENQYADISIQLLLEEYSEPLEVSLWDGWQVSIDTIVSGVRS